jgi:hypothetical protein
MKRSANEQNIPMEVATQLLDPKIFADWPAVSDVVHMGVFFVLNQL